LGCQGYRPDRATKIEAWTWAAVCFIYYSTLRSEVASWYLLTYMDIVFKIILFNIQFFIKLDLILYISFELRF
jgi:hypothetical protein